MTLGHHSSRGPVSAHTLPPVQHCRREQPPGGPLLLTWAPSALLAHSTMPWLCTPRMVAGFRLHSSATRRPCISASGMNFTRPLTTCGAGGGGGGPPTSHPSALRWALG